jgi:nucleotide-binding universal stress UspA family protein
MLIAAARQHVEFVRAASDLQSIAEQLREIGVRAEAQITPGSPAAVILQQAEARAVDLIVMSTQSMSSDRESGVNRWLDGSVAEDVLRASEVPVLLVPSACEREWSATQRVRIVLTLDGSPLSEQVLSPSTALADILRAEVILARVTESLAGDESAEAESYLQRIARTVQRSGLDVTVRVVAGAPGTAVATLARTVSADLIAMATRGRGGIARALLGSVAAEVVKRAVTPVLLVRAKPS